MYRTLSVKVHGKMLKDAARTCNNWGDDYRAAGLGMTGFIRTAINNEIERQKAREAATQNYFMQEV